MFRKCFKGFHSYQHEPKKKKKKKLNEYVYEFSVDHNIIDAGNIIDIHKYLMKKHGTK